jgi:hypothetical protein
MRGGEVEHGVRTAGRHEEHHSCLHVGLEGGDEGKAGSQECG